MYKKVILSILLFTILDVSAQSKIKKDRSAIKEMCGCFEVTFNFREFIVIVRK